MSMSIKIKDADGKEYELTYNLRTIKMMSDNGFKAEEAIDNPGVGVPQLFAGAFLAKHRTVPRAKIDEIWEQIEGKDEFILALAQCYNDPVEKLLGEPEEGAKKATWEVVK